MKNPLTMNEVNTIEEVCSEMMKLYGYKKVLGSNEKLKNMNLEFVYPLF